MGKEEWDGCFVELQIGVAPTQSHTFPMPPRTTHHHSEYLKLLDGLRAPEALYDDKYERAVDELVAYVNSDDGVPPALWHEMDSFMRNVSETVHVAVSDVLFNGSSWGALDRKLRQQALMAKQGAGGGGSAAATDTGVHTSTPSVLFFEEPLTPHYAPEDTMPWRELLNDGTFSAATLARTPTSFVAGGEP
eukprot:5549136-Prymnesium_polylepis.1